MISASSDTGTADALLRAGAAAAAGQTRDAAGLADMTDAVFVTPVLPCKAIAFRRFKASSRPERVAVAVLSVVSVITYLEFNGFVEVATTRTESSATATSANRS